MGSSGGKGYARYVKTIRCVGGRMKYVEMAKGGGGAKKRKETQQRASKEKACQRGVDANGRGEKEEESRSRERKK
jgi:hypothetical protein